MKKIHYEFLALYKRIINMDPSSRDTEITYSQASKTNSFLVHKFKIGAKIVC